MEELSSKVQPLSKDKSFSIIQSFDDHGKTLQELAEELLIASFRK